MPNIQDKSTTAIADSANHEGIRMWPSLETAGWIYDIANIGLIIGLAVGIVSTILIVWMGNIKEAFLRNNLATTMERVATAEQRAAEANQKAEEERLARVKIEEKIAPRYLPVEQYNILRDKLAKYAGMAVDVIAYPGGSPDIIPLSYQIAHLLHEANWDMVYLKSTGSAMFVEGVIVAIRNESDHDALSAAILLVEGLNANGIVTVFKNSLPEQDKGLFVSSATTDVLNKRKEITRIKILIGIKL